MAWDLSSCRTWADCHRVLHANGVHQEDSQLSNFRLVGTRLMALDFEMVAFDLSTHWKGLFMKTNIVRMVDRY
ncbi:hypothetical protein TOPH_06245 [Tolypocladium ophioglossoides CBS 100239]|uniref:Uncharacterized protein n=1 Tax=Tolypocladium ophioglossoides (strain CBS 100239) TaxID=1163406 RepID=A0A0L0N5I3_TOLOC|nr:hypothetical protein TOPH_06245 [Tolypocladium ophioglossoides CBS 100239]